MPLDKVVLLHPPEERLNSSRKNEHYPARLLQDSKAGQVVHILADHATCRCSCPEDLMRWIDVTLPPVGTCQETYRLLVEARTHVEAMIPLQERHGLDTPAVLHRMEEVGHLLFQALTTHDPAAFHPDTGHSAVSAPPHGRTDLDRGTGYHLVVPVDWIGLPWNWLHNGVSFLLESSPICAAEHGSKVPEVDSPRCWMQRHSDALFREQESSDSVDSFIRSNPEILFVPGHGREEIRRLIFREAEGIDEALRTTVPSRARLRIPGAVSPGMLASRAMLYQGLHFAAPTSQPPEVSKAGENRWLAGLMAAAGQDDAANVDELVGMELEILGVDPVEAALDQALAAHTRRDTTVPIGSSNARTGKGGIGKASAGQGGTACWLLDDGVVLPEHLGRSCLPPLIFSNSWCSLTWLAQRFRQAGASTFVGTSLAIYSRPARLFAAMFYQHLTSDLDAGGAHRQASLALRERLGPEHPGWLTYGLQGYGCLRLCDL